MTLNFDHPNCSITLGETITETATAHLQSGTGLTGGRSWGK